MPMIEVTAPAGAIAPDAREELLDELAGRLLHWEGAPDTEFFRANSWIYFNELPEDALYVGGRPGGDARIRVDVTTPEGALSQRRRAGLGAALHGAASRPPAPQSAEGYRVSGLFPDIT